MPYKLKVGPFEVEVNSLAEVKELMADEEMRQLAGGPFAALTLPIRRTQNHDAPIAERLKNIRQRIVRTDQAEALRVLAASVDGLTDAQIKEQLSLKDNHALGAIMQALSKYAKAEGLTLDRVMTKRTTKAEGGKGRVYFYRLTPEMRDVMNE